MPLNKGSPNMNQKKITYPIVQLLIFIMSSSTICAEPSAFFKDVQEIAHKKAEHFAQKRKINPDATECAAKDVATVAQAATNVGLNVRNKAVTEILQNIIKKYKIDKIFIDQILSAALTGVQHDQAQNLILADAQKTDPKEAKQASLQAIATYACTLATNVHPKIAEAAASKAAEIGSISQVLAKKIAAASATDAGIIIRTSGLLELINSITSKRVKKLVHDTTLPTALNTMIDEESMNHNFYLISISKKGRIWLRDEINDKWIPNTHKISDKLPHNTNELEASSEIISSIALNDRGFVWIVSKTGKILFQDGLSLDDDQIAIEGSAKQIVANNHNTVWMLSTDGILYYRTGISISKPEGERWEMIPHGKKVTLMNISWISLNDHNDLLALSDGKAYLREGTDSNPRGKDWTKLSERIITTEHIAISPKLREIVINNQRDIWALNIQNKIFFLKDPSENSDEETLWQQIPGATQTLLVAPDGLLWVLDTKSHLFTRTGITDENRQGTDWKYHLTAPAFTRLFLSSINLQNPLDEYNADKSRRENRRLQNNSINSLKKRVVMLEKGMNHAPRFQKAALKIRINRLKKLGRSRFLELKHKEKVSWLREFRQLKKENSGIIKTPKKSKTPKPPALKDGTYSMLKPSQPDERKYSIYTAKD